MRTYESMAPAEQSQLDRIAVKALGLYGLQTADLSLISSEGDVIFQVDIPQGPQREYHPYLGNLNGKRFLLQMREPDSAAASLTYNEIAWIAELLRDTEISIPEPVPSCSGQLVTEIEAHEHSGAHQCVLFRCTEGDASLEDLLYSDHVPQLPRLQQWVS